MIYKELDIIQCIVTQTHKPIMKVVDINVDGINGFNLNKNPNELICIKSNALRVIKNFGNLSIDEFKEQYPEYTI